MKGYLLCGTCGIFKNLVPFVLHVKGSSINMSAMESMLRLGKQWNFAVGASAEPLELLFSVVVIAMNSS